MIVKFKKMRVLLCLKNCILGNGFKYMFYQKYQTNRLSGGAMGSFNRKQPQYERAVIFFFTIVIVFFTKITIGTVANRACSPTKFV